MSWLQLFCVFMIGLGIFQIPRFKIEVQHLITRPIRLA